MTKPKWLTKEVKKVLIVEAIAVASVLLIATLLLIRHENKRHNSLYKSVETFKQALAAEGVETGDIETRCEKGGRGLSTSSWHSCTMHLEHNIQPPDREKANVAISATNRAVKSTRDFAYYSLLDAMTEKTCAEAVCSAVLFEKMTDTRCNLGYYPSHGSGEHERFTINFVCDDDSWFNKTFRTPFDKTFRS